MFNLKFKFLDFARNLIQPLRLRSGFEKITASSVLYFGCSKGFKAP